MESEETVMLWMEQTVWTSMEARACESPGAQANSLVDFIIYRVPLQVEETEAEHVNHAGFYLSYFGLQSPG